MGQNWPQGWPKNNILKGAFNMAPTRSIRKNKGRRALKVYIVLY